MFKKYKAIAKTRSGTMKVLYCKIWFWQESKKALSQFEKDVDKLNNNLPAKGRYSIHGTIYRIK